MDPLHITAVAAVEAKDLQRWTQVGNLRLLCPPNPARPLIRTWVRVPLTYYQSNPQVCTWITMTVVTLLAQSRQVQARQVRNFEFSRQLLLMIYVFRKLVKLLTVKCQVRIDFHFRYKIQKFIWNCWNYWLLKFLKWRWKSYIMEVFFHYL